MRALAGFFLCALCVTSSGHKTVWWVPEMTVTATTINLQGPSCEYDPGGTREHILLYRPHGGFPVTATGADAVRLQDRWADYDLTATGLNPNTPYDMVVLCRDYIGGAYFTHDATKVIERVITHGR